MYRRSRVAALLRADAPDRLPAEPILQATVAPVAPPLRRRLLQEEPLVLSPAAARLRDEFQELYSSGAVRAPTLVKLAWHIREAGDQAPAAFRDLAIDPSTPGYIANSARLLHNRFGYSRQEQHLYRLPVPVDTLDGRRMTMIPIIPPHEAIAAAYANNPAEFLVGDRDVPPDFVLHPLTRAYGTNNTFPLQIFVDAAGFTKKDSFVSFLMSSIYPGARRFCLAVVRKAELCSCGCRGLHTLDPIEAALVWGFRALAAGVWPTGRHDGAPFDVPSDGRRLALAGQLLIDGNRGVLLEYRADMLQLVAGLGLPSYSRAEHPCMLCWCTWAQLYEVTAADTWTWRSAESYTTAFLSSTIRRAVNEQQFRVIARFLQCSRKLRGCAITRPRAPATNRDWALVQAWGLRHGDILLREGIVLDPFGPEVQFNAVDQWVAFWRPNDDLACPTAWLGVPGFVLPNAIRLDVMHIADLGVTPRFEGVALRRLLRAEVWGQDDERFRVRRMVASLREWYCRQGRIIGKRALTRIGRGFSHKQLGPASRPFLKVKAAEARGCLPWVVQQLSRHAHLVVRGPQLLRAGRHLERFYKAVREDRGASDITCCAKAFLAFWKRAGGRCTIKHHMLVHIGQKSARDGCPSLYHTYEDESFHRHVKKVAATVHYSRFAPRVLTRLQPRLRGG